MRLAPVRGLAFSFACLDTLEAVSKQEIRSPWSKRSHSCLRKGGSSMTDACARCSTVLSPSVLSYPICSMALGAALPVMPDAALGDPDRGPREAGTVVGAFVSGFQRGIAGLQCKRGLGRP